MEWKGIERETGLVEWVCEHGLGHPDYESSLALVKKYHGKDYTEDELSAWLIHGCDGCCYRDDFPGKKR